MPKGKDIFIFVRFGGLNLKNQKGFGKNTFYSPPASKGFYAMPKIFQEFFLIGSLQLTQPHNFPKTPEWKEDFSEEEREAWRNWDWNEHDKKSEKIKSNIRKEFRKEKGYIWHHLDHYTPIAEIVGRHNAWVKTSIKAWASAVEKCCLNNRYGNNRKMIKTNSVNNSRLNGYYSKDEYEVFFDEKV